MLISRGLIVADPWISQILNGEKVWEMRSKGAACGWLGLIRKGTGQVWGVARLVESGPPMSQEEVIDSFAQHRIPAEMIRSSEAAKWNVPWRLADVRKFLSPVPYRHRPGAVTWVRLDPAVSSEIGRQLELCGKPASPALSPRLGCSGPVPYFEPPALSVDSAEASGEVGRLVGEVEIMASHIRNGYIHLSSLMGLLPDDVKGGSNASLAAEKSVTIDWGGPEMITTDIDKRKKMFRARGWVTAFYRRNGAEPGDSVQIMELGPYWYRVTLAKR